MVDKETIVKEITKYNELKIKELESILSKHKKEFEKINNSRDNCFKVLKNLEDSWSRFPLGQLADSYFHTLTKPPIEYEFNVEWGTLVQQPEGWIILDDSIKEEIDKKLPNRDEIEEKIKLETIDIKKTIEDIINRNSIIRKFVDMEKEYSDLNMLDDIWVYSYKKVQSENMPKDVLTRDSGMVAHGIRMPYHRVLLTDYTVYYNTINILSNKTEKMINLLKKININIPISEIKYIEEKKGEVHFDFRGATIGAIQQGASNTIENVENYINSGLMNIHHDKSSELNEQFKILISQLEISTELNKYQKEDAAIDASKIITELEKPLESQDKERITHSIKNIWKVTKDITSVGSVVIFIAKLLGITL